MLELIFQSKGTNIFIHTAFHLKSNLRIVRFKEDALCFWPFDLELRMYFHLFR